MTNVLDTGFQATIGKFALYFAILYIFATIAIGYSMFYTNPATCPMTSGMSYYSIPIG